MIEGRPEPRVEECMRCGCVVVERDAEAARSAYVCPMCGNTWSWVST